MIEVADQRWNGKCEVTLITVTVTGKPQPEEEEEEVGASALFPLAA